jgi:hypothetical protein
MPGDEAVPILTEEVDELWVFEDRDTRNDPGFKPLPRQEWRPKREVNEEKQAG